MCIKDNSLYITKQQAIDACNDGFAACVKDCIDNIQALEGVEMHPVVRGYWIDTDNYFYRWRCSVCRCHTKDATPPYCPNCGAYMENEL